MTESHAIPTETPPKRRIVIELKATPGGIGAAVSIEHKVARKWSAMHVARWFPPGTSTDALVAFLLAAAERGDLARDVPADCPHCTPYLTP